MKNEITVSKTTLDGSAYLFGIKENADKQNELSKSFVQGFACALVVLLKYEGLDTAIANEMFRSGIGSIKKAIECGVDEYDLEELKKYYK